MTTAEVILAALARAKDEVVFDAEKHVYTWADTGAVVPGVTTVMRVLDKPALIEWATKLQTQADIAAAQGWLRNGAGSIEDAILAVKRAHAQARDKAADAGTQAHALIEHASKLMLGIPSEKPDASDDAMYIFAGWQEWAAEVGYKPLAVESRVYSKRRNYAGTLDAVAELPGLALSGPAICDWKSGRDLYDEHHMQSVAYRRALSEMTEGIGADAPMSMLPGVVVILPKTAGPIKHYEIPHTEATWQAFLGALAVYQWKQELHPPRVKKAKKVA